MQIDLTGHDVTISFTKDEDTQKTEGLAKAQDERVKAHIAVDIDADEPANPKPVTKEVTDASLAKRDLAIQSLRDYLLDISDLDSEDALTAANVVVNRAEALVKALVEA